MTKITDFLIFGAAFGSAQSLGIPSECLEFAQKLVKTGTQWDSSQTIRTLLTHIATNARGVTTHTTFHQKIWNEEPQPC
eukprot:834360-Karenia_brevis.AAC.1